MACVQMRCVKFWSFAPWINTLLLLLFTKQQVPSSSFDKCPWDLHLCMDTCLCYIIALTLFHKRIIFSVNIQVCDSLLCVKSRKVKTALIVVSPINWCSEDFSALSICVL
jgi:hypothetical protein